MAAGNGVSRFPPCPEPSRERAASVVLAAVGGKCQYWQHLWGCGVAASRAVVAFFWCYSIACCIPPSVFKGIQRWLRQSSRQSEELLPARGSPASCPSTRALLVQSKAPSLSTAKAEQNRSALSFPAAPRAGEVCEQHRGSSALTLLSLASGL